MWAAAWAARWPIRPIRWPRSALDDSRYTLDHIEAKLARLPHGMQTEAGRRLGEQRLAWLRDFRAAFSAQWGGGQLR